MAMNTGTKLMLGLGTIGIVVGILVMILGAGSAGDAVNWRPTDDVYLENSQGETVSFIHIKETLLQFSYLMTLDVMILRLKYKAVKHCGKQIRVSIKKVDPCHLGMKMTPKGGCILAPL